MAWDRDLGDEPTPAWRDRAPDPLEPVDPSAPVSGHHPPAGNQPSAADAPEHDWDAAEGLLLPSLRPLGTHGLRLADIDPARLAAEGMKTHASPVLDDGPSGLPVGYVLRAGGFDVLVNADHILAWGVRPAEIRSAAMANLGRWSSRAPWTDEVSGQRRLISSASGEGADAARILLPEVRAHLVDELDGDARVLVGLPEADLLLVAGLRPGDEAFADLFADFVREHAAGADLPLDPRVHEIVGGELRPFESVATS